MEATRSEIGSEFWDVPTRDTAAAVFPESTQWYLSGRSALQAILRELPQHGTVAMPSWCCDSVLKPFVDAGTEVRFYPVYFRHGLVQDRRTDCDILFLMDYFGYTSLNSAPDAYRGVVIRDVTHSILSTVYSDADYCFGSLRKWCGVWTGGYAWTKDGHALRTDAPDGSGYQELRERAMLQKNRYIHGWGAADKGYLELFDEAEKLLENAGAAPAAERDVLLARRLDAGFIKARRRANAEILRAAFPEWIIFPELGPDDCPMFVPILVPDGKRDALRRHLISHEIYCPVHWPVSRYHRLDETTGYLYKNGLSLVCDQRYTADDMDRLVGTIRAFMGA